SVKVAMDADGDFVAAWRVDVRQNNVKIGTALKLRRFSAAGAPLGNEREVRFVSSSNINSHLFYFDVATDPAGDSVVAWREPRGDMYVQRFDTSGAPQGGAITVLPVDNFVSEFDVAAAMDSTGRFAVAWHTGGNARVRLYES